MIVMKFGGTSVADSTAISRTIEIIRKKLTERPIVVVSALSKVTDLLYKISDKARERDKSGAYELMAQLRTRHLTLAEELINTDSCYNSCHPIGAIYIGIDCKVLDGIGI